MCEGDAFAGLVGETLTDNNLVNHDYIMKP